MYNRIERSAYQCATSRAGAKAPATVTLEPLVATYNGKPAFAKKSGASGISVTSAGKAAVSKSLEPKTYSIKVKVSAKGNRNYSPASKTVTLKAKVKG